MPRDAKVFFPEPIPLAALAGASARRFDVGGVEVVALLHAGRPYVYRDLCPHMGGPMSEGAYDPRGGTLACPWHGYEFDAATGAFARNPNAEIFACMTGLYKSHKPGAAPALRLQAYEHELDGGKLWVRRPGTK